MKFDLSKVRQQHFQFDRTFAPAEVATGEEAYRVVAPVHLAFDLYKDKEVFRLVGSAQTELELSCSRCLEPFRMPTDVSFDQRYLPQAEASGEDEAEVAEEDLETSFYRDEQIDLNELLREQFYLVLPMKPLCREDCKGLCAQCGTNLNTGVCDCSSSWEDPRLAGLKAFKTREQ